MNKLSFILLIILVSCQGGDAEREPWQGKWEAKWETDPTGYGDLSLGMSFEMNGAFEFDGEEVTVDAYGFKGCIFGEDTLSHTQFWNISGDSLELQNTANEPGIYYRVVERSENNIKLQLVDDIFVTLTKVN